MWPPSSIDLENVDLVLENRRIIQTGQRFEPNPYTFAKIENGKKTTADATSLTPPSWLLLDHTIAVVWAMFSLNPTLQQLSIDDLKWAYEFLKRVKNKKGENPPDVKVCLKEIQDRLINLYANLTALKEGFTTNREKLDRNNSIRESALDLLVEVKTFKIQLVECMTAFHQDFDEIAATFGEKIIEDTSTSYFDTSFVTNKIESKVDALPLSPSRSRFALVQRHSSKDITKVSNGKKSTNYSKKTTPLLEEDTDVYDVPDVGEDDEVEKYIMSLFEDDKKEEALQAKHSAKSLIPMKKKTPPTVLTEVVSSQDSSCDVTKKEKISKRVHCFAEMRSLKFQKSMKLKDTNGEEAAYSNLKAEIQRLTINPNVSRNEVMKFLKEWRSEQVDRLHNELKRLSSIEEFMKSLNQEEVEPNIQMKSHSLKELDTEKSEYSWCKSLFP